MGVNFVQKVIAEHAKKSTDKSLIEVLVKNMGRYYPERSHKTVHASDVTKPDFCARRIRLMDATGAKASDTYINAALRATFDLGSITADRLVEHWMGDRSIGIWNCTSCDAKVVFKPKPESCVCGRPNWRHQEVHFIGQGSKISGSIDLIADLGLPKFKVVELKIMKADQFDKLAAPLAEHRLRTRLYLKLIEDSDNPLRFQLDTSSAKILYVSRGFGKMHPDYGQILPFREFDIDRDDKSIEGYLQNGVDVKVSREIGTIPIKKTCDSISCPTAKGCQVKAACWSGEYK